MSQLRTDLIRLACQNPKLVPHVRAILASRISLAGLQRWKDWAHVHAEMEVGIWQFCQAEHFPVPVSERGWDIVIPLTIEGQVQKFVPRAYLAFYPKAMGSSWKITVEFHIASTPGGGAWGNYAVILPTETGSRYKIVAK